MGDVDLQEALARDARKHSYPGGGASVVGHSGDGRGKEEMGYDEGGATIQTAVNEALDQDGLKVASRIDSARNMQTRASYQKARLGSFASDGGFYAGLEKHPLQVDILEEVVLSHHVACVLASVHYARDSS